MTDTYTTQTSQMKSIKDNSTVISEFINGCTSTSHSNNQNKITAVRPTSNRHTLPRVEVIEALTKLQPIYKSEYIAGQKSNINTDSFKSALLSSVAKINPVAASRSVNQIDGRTIDFVEMIFGAFLRNQNISPSIKSLLLKLQIPVIKIAMLDTKFFYNNKHPARNVLDEIAHIGIGIDNSEDTVVQTIDLIIDQLLNSFDKNIISFHTSLKALNRLKLIEQNKQDDNEKLARKNILKEHARQSVLTSLQLYVGSTPLPKAIQGLILKQWSTLMFHQFIRFGKDSEQWLNSTRVLSNIITSVRKAECYGELINIKNTSKEVHHEVESLLNETKLNKEVIHNSVNILKLTIKKNIELSEKYLATIDIDNNPKQQKSNAGPVDTNTEVSKEKIDNLPDAIRPGSWFEVFNGDENSVRRVKLSVIIVETAKLVFIDRQGLKVIEKDAAEFAQEIEDKKSLFIADHSIFNHALSNIILSLSAQS